MQSELTVDGDADAAVEARIRIGWNKFRQLVPFLTNMDMPLIIRGRLYSSCVAWKWDLVCNERKWRGTSARGDENGQTNNDLRHFHWNLCRRRQKASLNTAFRSMRTHWPTHYVNNFHQPLVTQALSLTKIHIASKCRLRLKSAFNGHEFCFALSHC